MLPFLTFLSVMTLQTEIGIKSDFFPLLCPLQEKFIMDAAVIHFSCHYATMDRKWEKSVFSKSSLQGHNGQKS